MREKLSLILALCIFFVSGVTARQSGNGFQIIEDTRHTLSAEAVIEKASTQHYFTAGSHQFNPGFTRSVYWIVLKLDSTALPGTLSLVIGDPHINKLEFYAVMEGKPVRQFLTGDHYSFHQRPVPYPEFVFPLLSGSRMYLARVDKSNESLQLGYRLTQTKELSEKETDRLVLTGIMTGMIILLMVFGLYMWILTGQRLYLFYIFYLASGWLWVISDLGYGFKYLWPDNPWFASRARPLFSQLTVILSVQYLLYFVGKLRSSIMRRLLNIASIVALVLAVVSISPLDVTSSPGLYIFLLKLIPAIIIAYVILGGTALVLEILAKNRMAMFYLAALTPLLLLVTFVTLNHAGLINITGSSLEEFGVAAGYLSEMIIFCFGMMIKFNQYRLEKNRLASEIERHQRQAMETLIDTEARERKRIADELHDIAGSMLSAALLNISSLHEKNEVTNHEARLKLLNAEQALARVSDSVRNLSHAISPAALELTGFKTAINDIASYFNTAGKIHYEVVLAGFRENDPELKKLYSVLYHIVFELMSNIAKHSGASEAMIQLIRHPDSITLLAEDNGRGIAEHLTEGKWGLTAIKGKVEHFNGRLKIENTKTGLTISIEIPLNCYAEENSAGR